MDEKGPVVQKKIKKGSKEYRYNYPKKAWWSRLQINKKWEFKIKDLVKPVAKELWYTYKHEIGGTARYMVIPSSWVKVRKPSRKHGRPPYSQKHYARMPWGIAQPWYPHYRHALEVTEHYSNLRSLLKYTAETHTVWGIVRSTGGEVTLKLVRNRGNVQEVRLSTKEVQGCKTLSLPRCDFDNLELEEVDLDEVCKYLCLHLYTLPSRL